MAEMNETFEKVREQEKTISHEILPRLKAVELSQEEFTREIMSMKQSQTNLELTVMKESQTTRQQVDNMKSTLTSQNENLIKQSENLFDIVKTSMGISSTRTTQSHELKMARWNHMAKVVAWLVGSSGVLYMILEHYFGK